MPTVAGRQMAPHLPFFSASLAEVDPEIAGTVGRELQRQQDEIELIASENMVSRAVLETAGTVLTNKYAEGYPGNRYYGGCQYVDEAETLAIERAMERTSDASIRKLLGDLAAAERSHISLAQRLGEQHLTTDARRAEEETRQRMFVLQVVQPGLAGLMDGSVSTLAPLFAAAFATHSTWETFLVGMAASVGAGISMGFAEALSDDGQLTGRGHPWLRGSITGLMTTLGGVGHTLPYLIKDFATATTLAILVVLIELWAIAWIRSRYMDTRFLRAAFEVVVGGLIVFAAGILIGSA